MMNTFHVGQQEAKQKDDSLELTIAYYLYVFVVHENALADFVGVGVAVDVVVDVVVVVVNTYDNLDCTYLMNIQDSSTNVNRWLWDKDMTLHLGYISLHAVVLESKMLGNLCYLLLIEFDICCY